MFGGDDGFDVDDEDFLELALSVEAQDNPAKPATTKCSTISAPPVVSHSSVRSATSPEPPRLSKPPLHKQGAKNTRVCDPLGLNKILLNNRHLKDEASQSSVSSPGSTTDSLQSEIYGPSTGNISTPTTAAKKFQFTRKPNIQTSPEMRPDICKASFSANAGLQSVEKSQENDASLKGLNKSIDGSDNVPVQSTKPSAVSSALRGDTKDLFDVSSSWDSDLDLSNIDVNDSPSWQPGKPFCQGTTNVVMNNVSVPGTVGTDSVSREAPSTVKTALRQSSVQRDCVTPLQTSGLIKNMPCVTKPDVNSPSTSTEKPQNSERQDCFKTPSTTKLRRPHNSGFADRNTPSKESRQCHPVMSTSSVSALSRESPIIRTPVSGLRVPSDATPTSSKASVSSSGKRKRKFPGPAGVLPKLKTGLSLEDMSMYKPASPKVPIVIKQPAPTDSQLPATQSSEDRFLDAPWTQMLADLEPQAQTLITDYSIASVLTKAHKKSLPRSKVPVLCVLVSDLSLHTSDASVVLRDRTGEMKGTVHRSVIKEYAEEIQIGAVLVLRQVGVFSPSGRNYYLTITPNNLVRIYTRGMPPDPGGYDASTSVLKRSVTAFCDADFRPPPEVVSAAPRTPVIGPRTPVSGPRLASPGLWRAGVVHRPPGGSTPHRVTQHEFGTPQRPGQYNSTPRGMPQNTFRNSTPSRFGQNNLGSGSAPQRLAANQMRQSTPQRAGFNPGPHRTPLNSISNNSTPLRTNLDQCVPRMSGPNMNPANAKTNKFTFRPLQQASPKTGTVAPSSGLRCNKPPGVGQSSDLSGGQGQRSGHKMDAAGTGWQDDQLDDLLRDLDTDEMLMDF